MCTGLPVIRYSCQILKKYAFSNQIFEKLVISDFTKIRSVGTELCHADGRTDRQT